MLTAGSGFGMAATSGEMSEPGQLTNLQYVLLEEMCRCICIYIYVKLSVHVHVLRFNITHPRGRAFRTRALLGLHEHAFACLIGFLISDAARLCLI